MAHFAATGPTALQNNSRYYFTIVLSYITHINLKQLTNKDYNTYCLGFQTLDFSYEAHGEYDNSSRVVCGGFG